MDNTKVYKKQCELCGKVIKSLSKPQFRYNFMIHSIACKRKRIKRRDFEGIENIQKEVKQNGNEQ